MFFVLYGVSEQFKINDTTITPDVIIDSITQGNSLTICNNLNGGSITICKKMFVYNKKNLLLILIPMHVIVLGQDNYEIQVYKSCTTEKGQTDFELHSNYTPVGDKQYSDKTFPSDKILHETIEITQGISNYFEIGAYCFNAIGSDGRTGFGGTHIRPRILIPGSLHLPVGLSLSFEFGYQRLGFFNNHWLFEIHPIIDKKIDRFYFSVNPTFDWNIDVSRDFEFNPCAEANYKFRKKIDLGLEWYGGYGPVQKIAPWQQQHQLLFVAADIDFGTNWEFNAGIGHGLNASTDAWIIKCILGRSLSFRKNN